MINSSSADYFISLLLNKMKLIKKMLPAGLASLMIAFAVMTLGTSANETTPAAQPRFNAEQRTEKRAEMEQMHEQMQAAIEANDYNAFIEAASDCPFGDKLLEKVTEENFPKFVEMHNHLDAAKAIADELGLPQRDGHFGGHMMHGGFGNMKGRWHQEKAEQ